MIALEQKYKAVVHYKYFLRSLRKVAKIHNVSKSSLSRWLKDEGVKRHKRKSKDLKNIDSFIDKEVSKNPFITLQDLSSKLYNAFNLKRSRSSISRDLKRNKFSYKKATITCSVPERVNSYNYQKLLEVLENEDTISIDESYFYVFESPIFGYSRQGSKLKSLYNPSKQKKRTISLIMAISRSGIVDYSISEVPYNTDSFCDFIEHLKIKKGFTFC